MDDKVARLASFTKRNHIQHFSTGHFLNVILYLNIRQNLTNDSFAEQLLNTHCSMFTVHCSILTLSPLNHCNSRLSSLCNQWTQRQPTKSRCSRRELQNKSRTQIPHSLHRVQFHQNTEMFTTHSWLRCKGWTCNARLNIHVAWQHYMADMCGTGSNKKDRNNNNCCITI